MRKIIKANLNIARWRAVGVKHKVLGIVRAWASGGRCCDAERPFEPTSWVQVECRQFLAGEIHARLLPTPPEAPASNIYIGSDI